MPTCPLCLKLADPPEADVIAEFPHAIALLGPWQYFTGYSVLVARKHIAELHHLDDAIRRQFVDHLCGLCAAIEAEFAPVKLNVESLGNQVPHLHVHVFPRTMDDSDRLKPVWLAIDRAERDPFERGRLESGAIARGEIVRRLRGRFKRVE